MADDVTSVAVSLERLRFAYGAGTPSENVVFDGLSERFVRGQFTALLGPSGCGKTTLLDLFAGVLRPVAGEVRWATPPRRLGYVFQEYPFLPWKTVEHHVGFPLAMAGHGRADIASMTKQWLERVGLQKVGKRPVDALSVGMKARVALATVMVQSPDVVLMDEPFRALDLETKLGLWRELERIRWERQTTVILVSHDLNEVIALADTVIVLSHSPCQTLVKRAIPHTTGEDVTKILSDARSGEMFRQLWADLRLAMGNHIESGEK